MDYYSQILLIENIFFLTFFNKGLQIKGWTVDVFSEMIFQWSKRILQIFSKGINKYLVNIGKQVKKEFKHYDNKMKSGTDVIWYLFPLAWHVCSI